MQTQDQMDQLALVLVTMSKALKIFIYYIETRTFRFIFDILVDTVIFLLGNKYSFVNRCYRKRVQDCIHDIKIISAVKQIFLAVNQQMMA